MKTYTRTTGKDRAILLHLRSGQKQELVLKSGLCKHFSRSFSAAFYQDSGQIDVHGSSGQVIFSMTFEQIRRTYFPGIQHIDIPGK